MAVSPRKKLSPKVSDMVAEAKAEHARRQAILNAMILEAKDG